MDLPVIGVTQAAKMTRRIDHEEVFDRVAFLLTTVIFRLVLGIFRPGERSLRTIMPNRGEVGLSCVCLGVSRVARSSAGWLARRMTHTSHPVPSNQPASRDSQLPSTGSTQLHRNWHQPPSTR